MNKTLQITLIISTAAAVGLAAVALGTAGSGGGGTSSDEVYELAIYDDESGNRVRTEWISPTTGEWRFEEDGRTRIFSGGRYAVIDPVTGTSLRIGSARIMGYLAIGAVGLEPLKLHIAGKREGTVSDRTRDVRITASASGAMTLRFKRDGMSLRGVVRDTMRPAEAHDRGLFTIPTERVLSTTTERSPGSRPRLPVRAYWFGPTFAGRSATMALEIARDAPPAAHLAANADRLYTRAYTTMYELPSAGGASSALPGRVPPAGEIRIVSQPLASGLSQANVRAMNGANGEDRYTAWPRRSVTLANGERATVVPNLAEGVRRLPTGEERISQFAVITDQTLTWLSGDFDLRAIDEVAAHLRAIGG